MNKYNVILDCDPGHDDAVAIMLAGINPNINLLGITTSSGNQTIEKTTLNASNICRYLGINVPIAKGASHPMKRELTICPAIHGASGLDGFDFPSYEHRYDPRPAESFIYETLLENNEVILIATGPLTNLGLLLKHHPDAKSHISKIILMGGSMGMGNVTPAAEFNINVDPEAAQIVFSSGLPVYMNGLDVTRKVLVKDEVVERAEKINNKASYLFVKLMKVFNENQKKTFEYLHGAPLHDPITLVGLLDPKAVKYKLMNVDIDVTGGPSYGRTNCDLHDYLHKQKNAYVAIGVSIRRYWDVVMSNMSLYK